MPWRFDRYRRLEPRQPFENLARGFRAEVHDPVWFLGRQWQLGEHQGEDASSPVQVRYRAHHQPLDPMGGDPAYGPETTPPEAIVESEPGDWWTPGRRVRLGVLAADAAGLPSPTDPTADPALLLAGLTAPWQHLDGRGYDGLRLYEQRAALGLDGSPVFDEVSPAAMDLWDPAELVYSATFNAGAVELSLSRHAGGRVDWYSVDASGPIPAPESPPDPVEVIATRLRYPGAPNPRWWEIEDAAVDIGGFPPDRSHFPTLLLVDLITSHADDWYTFPIRARSGSVVVLNEVTVRDSFGDEWDVTPPTDWHLFHVTGLQDSALMVWPAVTSPLSGEPIEDVLLGVDEDANLVLAVERRLGGRDVPTQSMAVEDAGDTTGLVDTNAGVSYKYLPSTQVPPNWHPYVIETVDGRRRLVQGRFADLSQDPPVLLPEAKAAVLGDPSAGPGEPVHQIEPATVPTLGLRLQRRWMLARRSDASPILWIQRQRLPLIAPPAIDLRFDVLEKQPTVLAV